MEKSDSMVSMAQQALTGANGGASVPAPEEPRKKDQNVPGLSGVKAITPQMKSAYDVAKQTVTRLSKGLYRGQLGMFDPNAKNPLLTPATQQQASSLLGAKNASGLLEEFLVQHAIRKQQDQQLGAVRPPNAGGMPEIDTRPLNERMTMIRPIGGGAAIPHYDYNGVSVALPDGVDSDDVNAVGAAMADQNALIDIMNGMNDEEG